MTMQSQTKYNLLLLSPKRTDYYSETFRVKSCLAKRKIKCNLQEIYGCLVDPDHTVLPRGGEGLLRVV